MCVCVSSFIYLIKTEDACRVLFVGVRVCAYRQAFVFESYWNRDSPFQVQQIFRPYDLIQECRCIVTGGSTRYPLQPKHIDSLSSSSSSSSSSIYLPYFHIKLQTYIMQWQATRKTQSSTIWRPIINRTVVNILLRKNIQ